MRVPAMLVLVFAPTSACESSDRNGPTTASDGDSSSAGEGTIDSGSDGSDGAQACDPNDPDVMVDGQPGDMEGQPCCTDGGSCSGEDTLGKVPQQHQLGVLLECKDGLWVRDDTHCDGECTPPRHYIGCFWHGPWRNCGCQ